MLEYIRRAPAAAFGHFAAILCGIALTWASAAFGLMIIKFSMTGCHGYGGGKIRPAHHKVHNVGLAIEMYRIAQDRCPATKYDLIADGDVSEHDLVDPWHRSIDYWCTEDDSGAVSAGPDGEFGTADDIRCPEERSRD